jgi:hypothetical protein
MGIYQQILAVTSVFHAYRPPYAWRTEPRAKAKTIADNDAANQKRSLLSG